MTSPNSKEGEVLGAERRRRWSTAEKLAMVRETYEPGMTVSLVARKCGINPNQLFPSPTSLPSTSVVDARHPTLHALCCSY